MRILLGAVLVLALTGVPAIGAEDAGFWLDQAADAAKSQREREFAARQLLMLADSSASILIDALADPASGLRRQVAAKILGRAGIPEAEAPLLEAAFGDDYFLAEAALAALARIYARLDDQTLYSLYQRGGRAPGTIPGGASPEAEDWLALSLDNARISGRFRSAIMRGVVVKYSGSGQRMPDRLAECVWDGLSGADRDLRLHAARAAAATGSSMAPEKLAMFLYSESEPKALIAALRSLAAMRPPEYGEAVERHVGHDNPQVAIEALIALDAMGYGGALFPLAPGMKAVAVYVSHPSTPVRLRAIEALGASKNPAALDFLLAALHDRVGANRAAAAQALGELGFPAAVGGVTPLLRDGRPEVRSAAALALHRLGVVGVAASVLDDLRDGSTPFRRAAAATLGGLGDARAVPALTAALKDDDGELACLAAEALGALRDRRAGPALYRTMTTTEEKVLADAVRRALADIFLDDPGASASTWESWARRHTME